MASHLLHALCCPPHLHPALHMESQGSGLTHPLSQPLRTAMGPTFQGLLWSLQRHREHRKLLSLCFCGCCFVCLALISFSKGKIHGELPVSKITHLVPSELVSQLLLI